jgi:hypothetical protein
MCICSCFNVCIDNSKERGRGEALAVSIRREGLTRPRTGLGIKWGCWRELGFFFGC